MRAGSRTIIILNLLLLFLASGEAHSAFAGPVEVQSIQVLPAETTIGRYPEITGRITATRSLARGTVMDITVIAVVVRPDHVMRSWVWKNIRMRAGDIRSFAIPKEYGVKLIGTYTVDFNIYSSDMLPVHKLSKTFVAVDQSLPTVKTTTPERDRGRIGSVTGQAAGRHAESLSFGVGLYADTLHGTGGATMLLWPFQSVGLQASYTEGSFMVAEGRLLVRFPLTAGITPYLGAGYVNVTTERSVELVGIKARFQNSGVSGVIGAEIPMSRSLFGYVEISGASVDLKKEVTNGAISGTATVKYDPVTIGIGIVYYLF
jgi:opacity protein-like surface antigen